MIPIENDKLILLCEGCCDVTCVGLHLQTLKRLDIFRIQGVSALC